MIGTPSDPNRARQKDFPVAMPPVSATRSMAHAPGRRDWRRRDGVLEEHRDRQRTDAAGHGRQRAGHLRDTGMHVADDDGSAAIEVGEARRAGLEQAAHDLGVGHRGDADVDDRRARLHERPRHEAGTADRGHEDVGGRRHGREVRRFRVADRHRRVPLQQQHRHRLPDDLAAADHHRVRARHRDAAPHEQLDDAGRRARHQPRAPLHQPADVHRVEAVHVLGRIDRVEHLLRGPAPHRRGKRRLHQDAVVHGARVQAARRAPAARRASRSAGRRCRSTHSPDSVPVRTLFRT